MEELIDKLGRAKFISILDLSLWTPFGNACCSEKEKKKGGEKKI